MTALFLSLISVLVLSLVPISTGAVGAMIWTDKGDYSPEETVVIYGGGFLPNNVVVVIVIRPNSVLDSWNVVSDQVGGFTTSYQLDGIAGTYTIIASDGTNEATATFTDTSVDIYATTGGTVSYAYTDSSGNPQSGTVSAGGSIHVGAKKDTTFDLTANPSLGCSFTGWTGGYTGTTNPYSWTVGTGAVEITANFGISDTTPPDTSITAGPTGWIKVQTADFSWTGSDDVTAVVDLLYSWKLDTGGAWSAYSSATSTTLTGLTEGSHTFYVRAKDQAGNVDPTPAERSFSVDITPPTLVKGLVGTPGLLGWYTSNVVVTLTGGDTGGSGLASVEYNLNGAGWTAYTVPFTISTEGTNTLAHRATDNAGNVYTLLTQTIKIDKTAPTLVKGLVGTPGLLGWYITDVQVTLTGDDAISGLDKVEYKIDAGGWTTYIAPFTMSVEGTHTLYHRAFDVAGNEYELPSQPVNIDKTAPTLVKGLVGTPGLLGWYITDVQVTLTGDDALPGSGLDRVEYSFDGITWTTYTVPFIISDEGINVLYHRVFDLAGREYELPSQEIKIQKTVSITITSSPAGLGFVEVDDVAITTPQTFTWAIGSTHKLEALSPVAGSTDTRYLWTSWSDLGAQTHDYIVPSSSDTVTANYQTQVKITFAQSGLDVSASGTVVTVSGSEKAYGDLSFTTGWLDSGGSITFGYAGIVASSTSGKQFVLVSASAALPFTVPDHPVTITGTYKTQFNITFAQTGVGIDFTGTVVIIDAANYDWSGVSFWWDENSFHGFAFQSPLVVTDKQYFWITTDGLSASQADASFKVTGSGAITGNYNFYLTITSQLPGPVVGPPGANVTMYYLSVVSPYGNPTGSGWYAPGSVASFGVTTPVDQGNQTVRIFVKWSGDVDLSEPLGTIVMNKPSEVIASWQTQYLVLFNTTLPNGNRLIVPGVPQALPPGLDIFGAFYAAGSTAAGGPAPLITPGPEGARYVFEGWDLDGVLLTPGTDFSFLVNGPHNASMVFDTEFLLVVNAAGVTAPFNAILTIAASPPVPYQLTPTSAVEKWFRKNAGLSLLISTPNKIGQGVWAVFKQWSGSAQGTDKSVSLVMSGSKTVNAVFFSTNPVAESLPYSIVAGLVCFGLAYYMTRNKKGEQKGSTRMTFGTAVVAIALLVAAIMSAMIATGFGINVGELPDLTNWAVLFLGAEALILFYITHRFTKGGQPEHAQAVLGTAEVPANPYGV